MLGEVQNDNEPGQASCSLAQVCKASAAEVETICVLKDPGEGGEKCIQQAKRESSVDIEQCHDRFGKQHTDGSNDGLGGEELDVLRPSPLRFWGPLNTQSFGSGLQDRELVCLFHAKRHTEYDGQSKQDDPLRPAPVALLCDEAANLESQYKPFQLIGLKGLLTNGPNTGPIWTLVTNMAMGVER